MKMENWRPIWNQYNIGIILLVTINCILKRFNGPNKTRDHPSTIKKRFISVFAMLFISPCFLYMGLENETLEKISLVEILGIKSRGFWRATILPLFLTIILFLGPISMEIWSGVSKRLRKNKEVKCCFPDVTNLIWIRNHVVAPISEEFTYRSCMLPILMQHFTASTAIFSCPLFFGVAHFHHFWERRNHMGMSFKSALMISCFQFTYTTLFGMYSAFIFYRTGHFVSVVAVHAFCNHMGFPEIREIGTYNPGKMMIVINLFFIGFLMWCYLLKPLTEPILFQHELYL